MINKKRGFTLIELLVVIILLAVVALIVTPIVINIIDDAVDQANMRSVDGHVKNVEYAISAKTISTGKTSQYDVINGVLSSEISLPDNDKIVCSLYTIRKGKVIDAKYCQEKNWKKAYSFSSTGGITILKFNGTYVAPQTGETHKGIIYMDPTDLTTVCTPTSDIDVFSRTTYSGCMKFYIFDDTGSTYKLLLDRNIGGNLAWISQADYIAAGGTAEGYGTNGNTSKGPITANKALAERTTGWIGSPRMITANEVKTITGATGLNYYFGSNGSTAYSSQNENQKAIQRSFHWLFDYTKNCLYQGCSVNYDNTYGYWTSNKYNSTTACNIINIGGLNNGYPKTNNYAGVRPVIEISKVLIKNQEKDSNEKNVLAHFENIELQITKKTSTSATLGQYDVSNGLLSSEIHLPDNDNVVCSSYTVRNGKVIDAQYCISNNWDKAYNYTKDDGFTPQTFNITFVPASVGETHKGIVYLDPSDLTRKCDENSEIASTNTGCKKFYIYDVDGSYYKMIMDRKLGTNVAWVSKEDWIAAGGTEESYGENGNPSKGPITINKALNERTARWLGSPRLMTADEVAHIVGADREDTIKWSSTKPWGTNINTQSFAFYLDGGRNANPTSYSTEDGWGKQYADSTIKSNYAWLYDYINDCERFGCNTQVSYNAGYGYWLSNKAMVFGQAFLIWYNGKLDINYIRSSRGIRPVIELPISLVMNFNGKKVAATSSETHKGIVYFDPSDLSKKCDENSTITTTNTGCKKFYIYNDTGDSYKMIMDRNTTAAVAWINHDDYIASGGTEEDWTAEKYKTQGPVTVTKQLRTDTANWIGNPKIISVGELRAITGNNGTGRYFFGSNNTTAYADQTVAEQAIQQSFHWLFDYTNSCTAYGCKIASSSAYGYWTRTSLASYNHVVWRVSNKGEMNSSVANGASHGVRPVIEIPKKLIDI